MSLELLTDIEVSKLFKVERSTVNTWVNRGEIPKGIVVKIAGTKRFIKEKLENWIYNDSLQGT